MLSKYCWILTTFTNCFENFCKNISNFDNFWKPPAEVGWVGLRRTASIALISPVCVALRREISSLRCAGAELSKFWQSFDNLIKVLTKLVRIRTNLDKCLWQNMQNYQSCDKVPTKNIKVSQILVEFWQIWTILWQRMQNYQSVAKVLAKLSKFRIFL